ncbi:MAG: aromatic amino acid lyase, partial [Phycisphaerales bacterium]|nr:aromatic amino acid lyase [Phycisphaerales bacterium]
MDHELLVLDGGPISGPQVVAVARKGMQVTIGDNAHSLMASSRATVEKFASEDKPIYGINTGFGALSTTSISNDQLAQLQMNLLRSHAAGVGDPLPQDVVRGMMVILAASLSRGHSGVRNELAELLARMLNANIAPVIPSRGSVGASGDLAPLAHLALVLCGEGTATLGDKTMPGKAAIAAAGLEPIIPTVKEGLALINGTHLMTSIASLALA